MDLSSTALPGAYKGVYEDGQIEIFILKPDGTFSQSLSTDGKVLYTNEGRWKIDQADVIFQNIYLAEDVWNLNKGKPSKADSFRAHWNPYVPSIFSPKKNIFGWIGRFQIRFKVINFKTKKRGRMTSL
jgi:hypothetical protein